VASPVGDGSAEAELSKNGLCLPHRDGSCFGTIGGGHRLVESSERDNFAVSGGI